MSKVTVSKIETPNVTEPLIITTGNNSVSIVVHASNGTIMISGGGTVIVDGNVNVNKNMVVTGNTAYSNGALTVGGKSVNTGRKVIWVPSYLMYNRATNTASVGTIEMNTNKNYQRTFDFDANTEEYVQFTQQMPKSWDKGNVYAQFIWSHPTTTVNFSVVWGINSMSYDDGEAYDQAMTNDTRILDSGGTANTIYISDETVGHSVSGNPGNENLVLFQIFRAAANVADTMAVDARLHGIKLIYNTGQFTDD